MEFKVTEYPEPYLGDSAKEILDFLVADVQLFKVWYLMMTHKHNVVIEREGDQDWVQSVSIGDFDFNHSVDSIPRSDASVSDVIASMFEHRISYIPEERCWYVWNGLVHKPFYDDTIMHQLVTRVYYVIKEAINEVRKQSDAIALATHQATNGSDDEKNKAASDVYSKLYESPEFKKHRAYRDNLGSQRGTENIVKRLKSQELISKPAHYFSSKDGDYFVCRNVVFNIKKYLELPAEEADGIPVEFHHCTMPITKYFDADYDLEDQSDTEGLGHFNRYLAKSVATPEEADLLQTIVGAAFLGQPKSRIICNIVGKPSTGKSVFLDVMTRLGTKAGKYVDNLDSTVIMKKDGQNFEQDHLRGKRFIGVSEPPNDMLDNEFLKKFSGDETVYTRTLNAKSGEWTPQGIIFIASNKIVNLNAKDAATLSRYAIIEFPNEFTPDNPNPEYRRDPNLIDKICDDRTRVLQWIVQGMIKYVKGNRSISLPETVQKKAMSLKDNSTPTNRFLNDYVSAGKIIIDPYEADPQYFLTVKDAYREFKTWGIETGEYVKKTTMRRLEEDISLRYDVVIHNGEKVFSGLRRSENFPVGSRMTGVPL